MEHINSWSQRAKCRGMDVNAFFPRNEDKGDPISTKETKSSAMKQFCKGYKGSPPCPVLELCKTYAIAHNELGIWGGTSQTERKRVPVEVKQLIRWMYEKERLLELRPTLEWILKREVKQQQAHNVPIEDVPA